MTRVHRNWLVNATHIKEFERNGETRVWVGEGLVADGRGIQCLSHVSAHRIATQCTSFLRRLLE